MQIERSHRHGGSSRPRNRQFVFQLLDLLKKLLAACLCAKEWIGCEIHFCVHAQGPRPASCFTHPVLPLLAHHGSSAQEDNLSHGEFPEMSVADGVSAETFATAGDGGVAFESGVRQELVT